MPVRTLDSLIPYLSLTHRNYMPEPNIYPKLNLNLMLALTLKTSPPSKLPIEVVRTTQNALTTQTCPHSAGFPLKLVISKIEMNVYTHTHTLFLIPKL